MLTSYRRFAAWLADHPGPTAFDCETTGLDPFAPGFACTHVALGSADGSAIVLDGRDRPLVRAVFRALADHGRELAAHNAGFDCRVLRAAYGVKSSSTIDTLSAIRAQAPGLGSYSLKALRPATAGAESRLAERWGGKCRNGWIGEALADLSPDDPALIAYVSTDAVETARLYDDLRADPEWPHAALDLATDRLWRWAGIAVDRDLLGEKLEDSSRRIADETAHFGFTPHTGSDARREWVKRIGVTGLDLTDAGRPSLAEDSRKRAIVPPEHRAEWGRLCAAIEAESQHSKLKELAKLSERDGRVHPTINANAARTGRMSVADPALQNLAELSRPLLIADSGKLLVGLDLSQVEPRLMAALSGDPALIAAVSSGDVYSATAAAAGSSIDRPAAKIVFLALMYGMGDAGLGAKLGVDLHAAKAARGRVLGAYPRLGEWIERTRLGAEAGEPLRTITDRPLPAVSPDKSYVAVNYLIQGSAADLFKRMTLRACGELPASARPWLPVHDELVVECDPVDADLVSDLLREHMRDTVNGVVIDGAPHVHGERWGKA